MQYAINIKAYKLKEDFERPPNSATSYAEFLLANMKRINIKIMQREKFLFI